MVCDDVLIPEYILVSPVVISISHAVSSTNDDVIRQK